MSQSNKRDYEDPKKAIINFLKPTLKKIPGFSKVEDVTEAMKKTGLSFDVGKDKVGIKFQKKF